jgi:hypothetical protein
MKKYNPAEIQTDYRLQSWKINIALLGILESLERLRRWRIDRRHRWKVDRCHRWKVVGFRQNI